MEIRKKLLFAILLLAPFVNSLAQEEDLRLRTAIAVGSDLWGDFDGSLEVQQRFKENISMYDRSLLTLSVGYGISKDLKSTLGYRMVVLRNSSLEYENKYRLTWDLRYRKKISYLELKFRTRMQYGYEDNIRIDATSNKLVNRNLVGASYHIPQTRFNPYLNYELFFQLNAPEYRSLNTSRLVGGCSITMSRQSELDVYYMFENEFNVSNPLDSYILGIAWEYSF